MKMHLLVILSLQVFSVLGQDYANIATPGITYFNNGGPELLGYRYDSVSLNGIDSVYNAAGLILRTGFYSCADTTAAPVISRTIIRKPDGTFRFLNISGDTILFLSQASLNQVWMCYPLSAGNRIEAKVTDIRTEAVADTTDLVKEITLMAKYQNGTVFPHQINGTKILLSKNYGFAKTVEWWHFPDSTRIWTMKGKTSPQTGLQDFSYRQCYDFEPGDEFHYHVSEFSGLVNTHIIERILQRTFTGGDTVIYTKEVCWIKWYPVPPPNTASSYDTISVIITGIGGPIFTSIPEQFLPFYNNIDWYADRFFKPVQTFNGRETKNHSGWFFCHTDNCWTEDCGGVDSYSVNYHYYAAGLGETGWYSEWWDGWNHQVDRKDLVYYRKGSEEWGTPFAPSCGILLSTEEIKPGIQPVTVFPNPVIAGDPIYIKENFAGCTALLTDLSGRILCFSELSQDKPLMSASTLEPGIYILVLTDKNGACKGRTRIIIR